MPQQEVWRQGIAIALLLAAIACLANVGERRQTSDQSPRVVRSSQDYRRGFDFGVPIIPFLFRFPRRNNPLLISFVAVGL